MPDYRELRPPLRLAAAVECFWTMRYACGPRIHRVTPDGCADILFSAAGLQLVGPMTEWRDHSIGDEPLFGVRFRPGMWPALIGVPAAEFTDRILDLASIWGKRATSLAGQLAEASSPACAARAIAAAIPPAKPPDAFAGALVWMERRRGTVTMDELAAHAGLSPRQLRRLALDRTGLSPKFLARVLRFRHAQARIAAARQPFADLALECGYYDQAHFINEYRTFSGRTPADRVRFFQSSESAGIVSSGA
jgi:AraC-like DNA-binding protein